MELRAQIRKRLNRVALETLVISIILRAIYSNFEFTLVLDTVYIMQRKTTKSLILLCAGSKRSQTRDIEKAKQYWQIIER